MSINYNSTLGTYVAQGTTGEVWAIYDPARHGTIEEFRNSMAREFSAD